jgi:hypothetical protein
MFVKGMIAVEVLKVFRTICTYISKISKKLTVHIHGMQELE